MQNLVPAPLPEFNHQMLFGTQPLPERFLLKMWEITNLVLAGADWGRQTHPEHLLPCGDPQQGSPF